LNGPEPEAGASYFVRVAPDRFRPTRHTSGAWSATEQHFSPLGGLLTNEIERFAVERSTVPLVTARIAFDILGTVELEDMDVRVEVVRAGRTIELLEAVGIARGRPFARARAWRLLRADTAHVAGGEPQRITGPDGLEPWPMTTVWPGGYIASLEVRPVRGPEPGRATVWVRTDIDLIAAEEPAALARFVALVDTANGIAVRHPPGDWFFPNVDLLLHFHRQPRGKWVGLDTTVIFGPTGQGVTSTTLHDEDGPVGVATQTLTIRQRGPG
jgi:hypothetical protein